ncbi:Methyltransferase domain containing protein [Candidatus Nanopelagicaceae bacterium]
MPASTSPTIQCELCGQGVVYAANRNEFNYFQCLNCKFLFIFPEPSSSHIYELYVQQEEIETSVQRKLGKLVSKIKSLPISEDANILDIGSQNGDFLEKLPMNFNWKLFGVEPSLSARDISLQSPRFSIKKGFFDPGDYEKKQFELVNLGDVIEHLEKPEHLVSGVKQICSDDGFFIVTTPIIDCPYVYISNLYHKLFRNFCPQAYLTPPHHIKYFTSSNLDNLLYKNGFSKIDCWFGPSNFSYEIAESEIFLGFRDKSSIEKFNPIFLSRVLVFCSMYLSARLISLFSRKDFSYTAIYQNKN